MSKTGLMTGKKLAGKRRVALEWKRRGSVYEEVIRTSSLRCIKHSVEKVVTSFCIEGYYKIRGVS
jgi:hypothetical protein